MAKTATLTIQQWGSSLAVRIPAAATRSAHFEVEVTTDELGVTVKPVGPRKPRKLTLAEKLARLDPEKHGGEAMATGRVAAEVF